MINQYVKFDEWRINPFCFYNSLVNTIELSTSRTSMSYQNEHSSEHHFSHNCCNYFMSDFLAALDGKSLRQSDLLYQPYKYKPTICVFLNYKRQFHFINKDKNCMFLAFLYPIIFTLNSSLLVKHVKYEYLPRFSHNKQNLQK